MSKSKPCPVCRIIGPPDHTPFHDPYCTPALRSLVRAAEAIRKCWDAEDFSDRYDDCLLALMNAVRRFQKERGR